MRIRIVATPREDLFDEYDVKRFRVGQIYQVPVRLASLLILAGFAESAGGTTLHAEAADFNGPQFRKR